MDGIPEIEDLESTDGYSELQQKIFNYDRDVDKETRETVWLETWQLDAIDYLKESVNTNRSKVTRVLIDEGLVEIREGMGDEYTDTNLSESIHNATVRLDTNIRYINEFNKRLVGITIDIDTKVLDNGLDRIVSIPMKKSVCSEINSKLKERYQFEGDIYRVIINAGLFKSRHLPVVYRNGVEEMLEDMYTSPREYREELEIAYREFLEKGYYYLAKVCAKQDKEEVINMLEKPLDHMQTDNKERCRKCIDYLKLDKTIIDDIEENKQ